MSARRTRIISRFNGLWHAHLPWRYTILFYSFLLILAVGPLQSALGLERASPGSLAIADQLYLAVMIARLVSLYVSRESKGNHHDAQDSPERSAPFKAGEET